MIEQTACVVAIDNDLVDVEIIRQSACGSCSAGKGCGTALLADWFPKRRQIIRLHNTLGVRRGDQVIVGLDEQVLQHASLLVYGAPLAGLIGGAVLGERIGLALDWTSELGAVLGGLLGMIVALTVVRASTFGRTQKGDDQVRLLRVTGRAPAISPGSLSTAVAADLSLGVRKSE
ncbi:MAG: SoxR reducing system RseC family protein [Gammaproteobacteria bacterium]|nr:SoxR reducing system RseC family protein [Gammaproteobacteria bacterium]